MAYGYGYGRSKEGASAFAVKEAYRTIRTNLMFSVVKKGCKVITFSSSVQGEGKTTTAANVAFSLARNNKKILLVDLDLRRPRVHRLLKLSNTPGLTNFLSGFNSLAEVLHKNVYENLDVICAGTISPNPAEMISSEFLAELLTSLQQNYDYMILDTSPINAVSDALPVIKMSDGVVLIARQKYSVHSELQKAIEQINFIDGKILGVVLNGVESEKKKYGRYGKYAKQSYGSYSAPAAPKESSGQK